MKLSIKAVTNAASKAVNQLEKATESELKETRDAAVKMAEKAAEEARKAAENVAKKTTEAEAEARKQADAIANQARKAQEEARKATEVIEAAKKEAIEVAKKAAEELQRQAEAVVKDQIKETLNSVMGDVEQFTNQGREFIKQIQNEIQDLIELANIDALIKKLLSKAEELGEEYLNTKVQPIAESIQLGAVSDIKLDLQNTDISVFVNVYFLLLGDKDKDPVENAIAAFTTEIKQNIIKLQIPRPQVLFKFNKDRVEKDLQQMIQDELEDEKEELIQGFLMAFFSDYVAIFKKIMEYLPK
ncbi:hypothetical protein [Bacillus thuringiensis]|uniref:hypothetical protein n=1 Tax=Bacillus thuringiensis TaxID=1428 RepID=UPI000BFD94B7|nr:hypothetical protein [Bacillus thuringiensis]PGV77749.1 hypothetical protein COD83_15890 [Bacillus thuringiensis]